MGTSTATWGRGCSKGCFSAFHETARETIGWMTTTNAFRRLKHFTVAYFPGLAFNFGVGTS